MSIRLEMLQVARLAPKILGDSADLVTQFIANQQNPDGGFKDRSGASDLYYTMFALDSLISLQTSKVSNTVAGYLRSFESGRNLDFVHLCCLARAHAAYANINPDPGRQLKPSETWIQEILGSIEQFRCSDGGYNPKAGSKHGTTYGSFLGLGAYLDLGRAISRPLEIVRSLKLLESTDGAWGNEIGTRIGGTNPTAAAVTALRHLHMPINGAVGNWLLERFHPQGGFVAMPAAPMPDLLSTATALHALSGLEIALPQTVRDRCLDYVDSLWTNAGGFHGNWSDDELDCEYAFYGLLALGHLAV